MLGVSCRLLKLMTCNNRATQLAWDIDRCRSATSLFYRLPTSPYFSNTCIQFETIRFLGTPHIQVGVPSCPIIAVAKHCPSSQKDLFGSCHLRCNNVQNRLRKWRRFGLRQHLTIAARAGNHRVFRNCHAMLIGWEIRVLVNSPVGQGLLSSFAG